MGTPELEHRVNRLENDVQAIYELLAAADRKLDTMTGQLTSVSAQQLRQGNRLDQIDSQLDTQTANQQRHGNRLDQVDSRLARIIELLEQR